MPVVQVTMIVDSVRCYREAEVSEGFQTEQVEGH